MTGIAALATLGAAAIGRPIRLAACLPVVSSQIGG
jgi:hypothetical protein